MPHPASDPPVRSGRVLLALVVMILAALATVGAMLMLDNIRTRKEEGKHIVFRLTDVDETTVDPEQWGMNFPRQYDSYRRTVDIERTRYGGSENIQKLDEDFRLRTIFAGYGFAIDYREERGHAYMLSDQRETERVHRLSQPGACLHCHASVVPAYRKAGVEAGAPGSVTDPLVSDEGMAQLMKGFEAVCAMPYDEATSLVSHPVSCIDCHDPRTNALRVTRPAFMEGLKALANSADALPHLPSIERWREGDRAQPYDANALASRQELRSMVCMQCHVEYYFKGDAKTLTYPWHNGFKVEQIQKYYDDVNFADWTHAESGARVLKAQHPEAELWSQGIHARSGVSCADCHMPYLREGAMKVSSHHVRSPMLNIAQSCQVCHRYDEQEILARVTAIQDRTRNLLDRAEDAVLDLVTEISRAKERGATDDSLARAREFQRTSQFRMDFIAAENSMGFHAPQEAARILAEAIDLARQGQVAALEARPGDAPAEGAHD